MRCSLGTKMKTETQILSFITLFCYMTALVAIGMLGHALFELALRAAGQEIVAVYTVYGI